MQDNVYDGQEGQTGRKRRRTGGMTDRRDDGQEG